VEELSPLFTLSTANPFFSAFQKPFFSSLSIIPPFSLFHLFSILLLGGKLLSFSGEY
jgi:hypothetical protein